MGSRPSGHSVFHELRDDIGSDISQQSAAVCPFFIGAFVVGVGVFEFSRRQLPKGWRFAYLIALGFGAALLVAPWVVDLFYS